MGKYSKYKHVTYSNLPSHKNRPWVAIINVNGRNWRKRCLTEHRAAVASDKKLIEMGSAPVNILKLKTDSYEN